MSTLRPEKEDVSLLSAFKKVMGYDRKDSAKHSGTYADLEKYGQKVYLDNLFSLRIDILKELRDKIRAAKDQDDKIELEKEYIMNLAHWGEPADNEFFFKKLIIWLRLYGYYKTGRDAAEMTLEELKHEATKLHIFADVVRGASMMEKHVTPSIPIVLSVQQQLPQKVVGGGSDYTPTRSQDTP